MFSKKKNPQDDWNLKQCDINTNIYDLLNDLNKKVNVVINTSPNKTMILKQLEDVSKKDAKE